MPDGDVELTASEGHVSSRLRIWFHFVFVLILLCTQILSTIQVSQQSGHTPGHSQGPLVVGREADERQRSLHVDLWNG